ncbi:PAS domain-containing sensor histidine kinase [Costertonia aggregata]|uniref:histidine kinase n=1 Tax=Costertonia aggregata TaxID=343403 RepID=A0A7H9AQ59_9FLAO|nr:PAS domain-containing protein [Costertonia aggregata]QLG45572.1 PAS domain-containing protein [Costertonia aggregata]
METLSINFLIKDSPTAVAILDNDMRFISHSNIWLQEFNIKDKVIIGKSYYDVIQNTPQEIKDIHQECLKGTSNTNKGKKFIYPDGTIRWFKWKINAWKNEDESVGGLIVIHEDITKHKKREELLKIAESVGRIGGWELDLKTNVVYWTKVTKEIHEVPEDYMPSLEEGINFYKEGEYRQLIGKLVGEAISYGKPWDTELIIVTAKGNEIWVRAKGEVETIDGKCVRLLGTFQDIDERKRAELEFKAATERLAIATKGANVGIWDYDIVKNELVWDDNMYRLYGIKKEDFNGVYEAWQAGLHPDDKEQGDKEIALAISGEKEFDTEFRVVWPNGEIRYIKANAVTQRDNEGRAIKMIGTNWDITESVRAELKNKEISERLHVATRAANIGIWDYKINEKLVVCNDYMYDMYDIPKNSSNLLNEWMHRIHPEDKERIHDELEMTIAYDKPFNTQFRGIRPNGDIIHIIAFGEAQKGKDGKVRNIIGANWDITELKTTKLQLERVQESFKGTFENSAVGMALVSLDGKWISVNKGLCDSLGYTEKELLQMTFQELTFPEDLNTDLKLLQQVVDGKISTYQIEKRYYHKKGDLMHAILTVTAVKDIEGKLSHFISQILDISSRIHAENRTKKLLDVTKEQNESLLNFAHIVSHNLRSHSSNLSMLSGFLASENDADERKNLMNMLNNASESLAETVMHLNEVVQVKVGASEKIKNVNIHRTLKNVEKNLSVLLKEKDVVYSINVPHDLKIKGIPAYFDSIFLNLFSNSVKYAAPERQLFIKIDAVVKDDVVTIAFEDNGIGIDLERHGKKLFGMYKTFHRNKDAKGIGLFITKNQVEAMNGSIEVKSRVDQGTTFLLTFSKI